MRKMKVEKVVAVLGVVVVVVNVAAARKSFDKKHERAATTDGKSTMGTVLALIGLFK